MTLERVRMAYLSMPAMLWARVQRSFELPPIGFMSIAMLL